MKAFMFQAALLCEDCGDAHKATHVKPDHADEGDESSYDSDEWPKGPYEDGGGEADCPQHCDACGLFLENPLTGDGENYVLDAFRDYVDAGHGSIEVLVEWRHAYSWMWDHYEDVSLPLLLEMQDGAFKPGQEERYKRLAGS